MSTDKTDFGPDDNPMPVWMGELCERFEKAWGSKNPISVESIIDRIPADKRTIALKTLVEAEYVLRSATNDELTARELAQRFPNDVDVVLNIHRRLAGNTSPSSRETIAPRNATSDIDVETGSKLLQIPRQLGRYRIIRKLGQGAMGFVFLAKDEQLDRQVALKFQRGNLQQGGEQQVRFLREAQAAAALHHANICPIYDAGEIQGINYICMGYVDGSPLSQFAVQDSGLTEQQIARIILQVAKAVAVAHGAGFIHRDLKPANIMINLNNEPVILDFGLARRINRNDDQRVTLAGAIMGSPCYMSPEQVDGAENRIGPQSDIYSLGVILYELLTGRVPFEGSFASVMGQIMTKTPDKPSVYRKNLSVRLETICTKMMAKQQDQRFLSMQAAAEALQEYLDKFDGATPTANDDTANETAPTNKGEQRKHHIEKLIKAGDYGPAETLLVSLSRETSDVLRQYAVWAAAELPKLRKLREQVRAGRTEMCETAVRLMKSYDYEQVVRLLSDYPYEIRTPNMQQLLERAERLSNEAERLTKGIAAARTRVDNESLMRLLQEKLKLKPYDREAKESYDQLVRRSEGPISKVLGGKTVHRQMKCAS
ncbi:MAG: serine/threonine-protein kinase [Planctomycetaceae bacterium]